MLQGNKLHFFFWLPRTHESYVYTILLSLGFPGGGEIKNPPASTGDVGSIPGSGRSPGGWNGNPLQHPCLENPGTEEAGRLQSLGSPRVGHHWATGHILWSIKCAKALCLKQTYIFILKCFIAKKKMLTIIWQHSYCKLPICKKKKKKKK